MRAAMTPTLTNAVLYTVIAVLAISVSMNYILYSQLQDLNQQVSTIHNKINVQDGGLKNAGEEAKPPFTPDMDGENNNTITAVAVRQVPTNNFFQSYALEGATLQITVEIKPGDGKILVNTFPATGVDFQSSARTAVMVAENIANVDLSTRDVIFSIESDENMQTVDGQSAGAAMSVLLISELTDKDIRTDVLITGSINPDGSIGRVGGIIEKADAAGKYGAKTFLVPAGQGTVPIESCEEKRVGSILYRNCQFEPATLSPITQENYGMDVIEVTDIQEALSYFIK